MSKRNRERKDKEKEPLLLAEAVTETGIIVGFGCTADCAFVDELLRNECLPIR